ncbi:MAG: M48 family metallopeptidase [Planctomycetota bacterium]
MDFFQHQDQARRNTGRMVVLFVLAVLALIVGLNVIVGLVLASQGELHPMAFVVVTVGVIVLVTLGSLYRIASLRGGGRVVAEMLGGRRVDPGNAKGPERRLLNVVEEMAIASGAPVPQVYVLDAEPGINAFAAGYHFGDAVVGVTRGTLEQLDRDELQGVIAHEFSHILNGDMRLNIRLMGVLYGILLIGLLGMTILRSLRFAALGRRRGGRSGDGGQAVIVMLAIGAALMIAGYAGIFFGNLIKAAASRQREYLADASAVQYTRNPAGIAGALMKIGGLEEGSRMDHPAAPEASHLFFGNSLTQRFGSLGATHPPLEERVARLLPSLAGRLKKAFGGDEPAYSALQGEVAGLSAMSSKSAADAPRDPAAPAASALDQVGAITGAHLARARELLDALPTELRRAASEPFSARAIVYALLLDPDERVRAKQARDLERHADSAVLREFAQLEPAVRSLPPEERLPLVELCIPALTELTREQYARFTRNLEALIQADGEITFEEFALERLVRHHLDPIHDPGAARGHQREARGTLGRAAPAAALVLSHLARAGADDTSAATHAFDVAWRHLALGEGQLMAPANGGSLGPALDTLSRLAPEGRRQFLAAAAAAIAADGVVNPREAELFRLLGETLDVPIPPLLAGQTLA